MLSTHDEIVCAIQRRAAEAYAYAHLLRDSPGSDAPFVQSIEPFFIRAACLSATARIMMGITE